ncbi:HD-GYP domain-containing protein [Vulgatibacter sp.]|uniref:HD-GYP domain-containing protein n=1 Tax=Vulgatibacter sp. TaxID=1971226 RepID=UPI003562F526
MPEVRLTPDWNLELYRPIHIGVAGAVAAALAAAAAAASAGSALASAASMPLLGLTAAWLQRRRSRPSTSCRVQGFLETLEARDRYTASHCSRVAAFADLLAEELGLDDPKRLRNLRIAALLHDLGKLDVSLEILHKPGKLDDVEWRQMRAHVQAGTRRASCLTAGVRRIIAQHHERPDGRGYPRQLKGEQISLEARIVAVADAFDAMTSDRPYRKAVGADVALAELNRTSLGTSGRQQFDPEIVAALERRFTEAAALCTAEAARESSPHA